MFFRYQICTHVAFFVHVQITCCESAYNAARVCGERRENFSFLVVSVIQENTSSCALEILDLGQAT